ncbi:hypothetical protein LNAOJCKE_4893 [Methylorubrum aminovorans]|uniref:Uncharacterized protein n=1 Tax=Methylorubrum aminovorans TaxID=269069 RepID=A0ABQ4UK55_9HYPH|nr:hypothetical protein LNAOJCKE_4893 [Methylorubrum aminovorans]GMA79967.1 hypothetical protein GCM10025880_63840 [Methylorubrum aminovorans]
MDDASPKTVATQFGIAAALSFSAMALPFVPEAILAYAGYRYLRHFTYGWRTWRAPARVPLHLGRRGYRDATTRRRGDATWPIGLAATGQVWLRREDLVQGLSFFSDGPDWHSEVAANLVFGACLNRMGAIVVQSTAADMMTAQLAEVARPFGRDGEIRAVDLRQAPRQPLLISTANLADAIADLRLGPEASAVNRALLPIIEMLASRYRKSALDLYQAFTDETAFKRLLSGEYEIDRKNVSADTASSADGAAFRAVLKPLKEIPKDQRETGRKALVAHAGELAALTSVSLTNGLDLKKALLAGGLVCIRPSSPLTTALVIARCTEALASMAPGQAAHTLVHIVYPDVLSGVSAQRFREAAAKAGAIGSLAHPARPAHHVQKAIRKGGALRIQSRQVKGGVIPLRGKIASTLKDCPFDLDLGLPDLPESNDSEMGADAGNR